MLNQRLPKPYRSLNRIDGTDILHKASDIFRQHCDGVIYPCNGPDQTVLSSQRILRLKRQYPDTLCKGGTFLVRTLLQGIDSLFHGSSCLWLVLLDRDHAFRVREQRQHNSQAIGNCISA